MENNNGEIEKRTNPSREPFSDVSNAASSSSVPLPNPKRRRKLKPRSKQLEPDPGQIEFLTRSETDIVSTSREIGSCSTAGPSDFDLASGDCNFLDMSERTTVYKRKNTSKREHTTHASCAAALSCTPRRWKTEENKGKKSKKGDANVTRRVFSSAPCKRRKKPEDFKLPEDFVREHRDYFSKLDEEELIVEEANSE